MKKKRNRKKNRISTPRNEKGQQTLFFKSEEKISIVSFNLFYIIFNRDNSNPRS